MWVIFPILGCIPIFHGLWVIRTVGCCPRGLYSYPSWKLICFQRTMQMEERCELLKQIGKADIGSIAEAARSTAPSLKNIHDIEDSTMTWSPTHNSNRNNPENNQVIRINWEIFWHCGLIKNVYFIIQINQIIKMRLKSSVWPSTTNIMIL